MLTTAVWTLVRTAVDPGEPGDQKSASRSNYPVDFGEEANSRIKYSPLIACSPKSTATAVEKSIRLQWRDERREAAIRWARSTTCSKREVSRALSKQALTEISWKPPPSIWGTKTAPLISYTPAGPSALCHIDAWQTTSLGK